MRIHSSVSAFEYCQPISRSHIRFDFWLECFAPLSANLSKLWSIICNGRAIDLRLLFWGVTPLAGAVK